MSVSKWVIIALCIGSMSVEWGDAGEPEPAKKTLAAVDFIPVDAIAAVEIPNPALLFNTGLDRAEQAAGLPGQWRKMLLAMLQAQFGDERVLKISDVASAVGLAPTKPAVMGFLASVNGQTVGSQPEGMFFLVLPVTNRQVVEKLINEQFLSNAFQVAPQTCRRIRNSIRRNWRFRAFPNFPGGKKLADKEALLALPALKPYRCPAGGRYSLEAANDKLRCSAHKDDLDAPDFADLVAKGMTETPIGKMTLVGSEKEGVAYGIGSGYCVIARDPRVVRAVLEAAAGKRPRLSLAAAVGTPLVRGGVQFSALEKRLRLIFDRSYRAGLGEPSTVRRLLAFLREHPPVQFQLTSEKKTLILTANTRMGNAPLYQRWKQIPAGKPGLGLLLPQSASLMLNTNMMPELLELVSLIIAAADGGDAALIEWLPLAFSRAFAWGVTNSKPTGLTEMPNMVFLASREGETAKRALELLPKTFSSVGHLRAQTPRQTPGGVPYDVIARVYRPGDAYKPAEPIFFYGGPDSYLAVATTEADLLQIADKKNKGLVKNESFIRLGSKDVNANLAIFIDLPTFAKQSRLAKQAWRIRLNPEAKMLRPLDAQEKIALHAAGKMRLDVWVKEGTIRLRLAQEGVPPAEDAAPAVEPATPPPVVIDAF